MMKKILFVVLTTLSMTSSLLAQDENAPPNSEEFDKKFRFGLRVAAQPTWFNNGTETSNIPSGAKFGFGFGLNIERRFSSTAALLTGIGADFEGGKYKFRNDPAANFEPMYWMDENNELVKATAENRVKPLNTGYLLKDRTLKTTYVTIPIILKLSTKEIGGLKYSGMFGGELGIRLNATAKDSYLEARKYNDSGYVKVSNEVFPISNINVGKECTLIPLRVVFNAGLGIEYRLSEATAFFVNVNYFMTLTNQLRKKSTYTIYKTEPTADTSTPIDQMIKTNGIRISLGIMF